MLSIAELKSRAKVILEKYYIKIFLVSLIMNFLFSIFSGGYNNQGLTVLLKQSSKLQKQQVTDIQIDGDIILSSEKTFDGISHVLLILVLVIIITILLTAFIMALLSPLVIGNKYFFMRTIEDKCDVGDLFMIFSKEIKITKPIITMILRELIIILWTLCFIVPGIIKHYEYKMVAYILSENPEMDTKRALEISKRMMYGHKLNTFLLDLSFVGWNILSAITLNILGVLFVYPYYETTYAYLYSNLREEALNNLIATNEELPGFKDNLSEI